jgi:hypothetical protein
MTDGVFTAVADDDAVTADSDEADELVSSDLTV